MLNDKVIKKIILLPCFIFLLLFSVLIISCPANAADLTFTPNVSIGGEFGQAGTAVKVDRSTLGNYISAWYSLIVGVIGILATVMVMYGGFRWLTSGGGAGKNEAKDIILSALVGLVLAFLSYTILYLINPNLLTIGLPEMAGIQYDEDFNIVPVNPQNISTGPLMNRMNLSPESAGNIRDYLTDNEGIIVDANGNPIVYDDGSGNLTAGTGHLLRYDDGRVADNNAFTVIRNGQTMTVTGANVQLGDVITQQQAETWFAEDIAEAASGAAQYIPHFESLPTEAQTVATDLAYQYGPAGAYGTVEGRENFPGLADALDNCDYVGAAAAIAANESYMADFTDRANQNINTLLSLADSGQ